jgi:hypothetical protein
LLRTKLQTLTTLLIPLFSVSVSTWGARKGLESSFIPRVLCSDILDFGGDDLSIHERMVLSLKSQVRQASERFDKPFQDSLVSAVLAELPTNDELERGVIPGSSKLDFQRCFCQMKQKRIPLQPIPVFFIGHDGNVRTEPGLLVVPKARQKQPFLKFAHDALQKWDQQVVIFDTKGGGGEFDAGSRSLCLNVQERSRTNLRIANHELAHARLRGYREEGYRSGLGTKFILSGQNTPWEEIFATGFEMVALREEVEKAAGRIDLQSAYYTADMNVWGQILDRVNLDFEQTAPMAQASVEAIGRNIDIFRLAAVPPRTVNGTNLYVALATDELRNSNGDIQLSLFLRSEYGPRTESNPYFFAIEFEPFVVPRGHRIVASLRLAKGREPAALEQLWREVFTDFLEQDFRTVKGRLRSQLDLHDRLTEISAQLHGLASPFSHDTRINSLLAQRWELINAIVDEANAMVKDLPSIPNRRPKRILDPILLQRLKEVR